MIAEPLPSDSAGKNAKEIASSDRLSMTMGAVWLLGVVFALLSLLIIPGIYLREVGRFREESKRTHTRLRKSWQELQQQLTSPPAPSQEATGLIRLTFAASGLLKRPVHLALPEPPVQFSSSPTTASKAFIGADLRAQRYWKAARLAQQRGDIHQAIQWLQQIPTSTFAANGMPLKLLAAYRLWELNAPQAAEGLLYQLRKATLPYGLRQNLLARLKQQPQFAQIAQEMIAKNQAEWRRWSNFAPPGRGKWKKQALGARQGLLFQGQSHHVAWISVEALRRIIRPVWHPLTSTGQMVAALSLRTYNLLESSKTFTLKADHALLVAGPLQLSLRRVGWLQRGVVLGVTAALLAMLVLLLMAGFAARRMFQRERQLHQQQKRLAAAVTHELRSPLTSLALTAELLTSGDVPTERLPRYHERLEQQVQRLRGVVDNVISLYRRGTPSTATRSCDLVAIANAVYADMQPVIQRTGSALLLDHQTTDLQPLPLDADSLSRVLYNLIDNAMRHAPGSDILLKLGPGPTLAVSDQGPGIPQAICETLFAPFVQGPQGADHRQGLGLGLAFVHDAVTRTGGTIQVTSQAESGACFLLNWSQNDDHKDK